MTNQNWVTDGSTISPGLRQLWKEEHLCAAVQMFLNACPLVSFSAEYIYIQYLFYMNIWSAQSWCTEEQLQYRLVNALTIWSDNSFHTRCIYSFDKSAWKCLSTHKYAPCVTCVVCAIRWSHSGIVENVGQMWTKDDNIHFPKAASVTLQNMAMKCGKQLVYMSHVGGAYWQWRRSHRWSSACTWRRRGREGNTLPDSSGTVYIRSQTSWCRRRRRRPHCTFHLTASIQMVEP